MGKLCLKCGLPLAFKKTKRGKWCPTNPDGSDHWDLCRQTWLAALPAVEHARIRERDRIEGLGRRQRGQPPTQGYFYCGDVPPWDESLWPYRKFTKEEKAAGIVCSKS